MARSQTATSTGRGSRQYAAVRRARTQKVGRVVSDKMDKTVVVAVDYVRRHPLYHKRITRTSKFMAHDEKNECKIGRHRADRGDAAAVARTRAGSCARSSSGPCRSSVSRVSGRQDRRR